MPEYEYHAENYQVNTSALVTESGGTQMGILKRINTGNTERTNEDRLIMEEEYVLL